MHSALALTLALAVGVLAQSVARHLRVPGIVLLLLTGATFGPDLLGWIRPRDLGEGMLIIVDLAVAVILFEGGLNLQVSRLRREQASIRRLVTWGALITLAGGALAAWALLDWSVSQSLLFASLIVVTGPTVVGPLLSELRVKPRPSTVLEAEGVLIDPIGAILAVLVLEVVMSPGTDTLASEGQQLVFRLGFGAAAGMLGGFLLASLLKVRNLIPEGHQNVFVLASVLLLFEACDQVVSLSGLMAVTLAGVVVGNSRIHLDRDLRDFKEEITLLLIGLLFIMLAADVRIAHVVALGWSGVAVVAVLVFLVRPLGVVVSTVGSDLSWRERAFVSWIAPRGIVAAAIASVVASVLDQRGIGGGDQLRAMVFLTISCTVVLAGLTGGIVGRLLGVRLPARDTIAILGAHALGLELAEAFRRADRPVVFLDSNPSSCRRAEEAGFPVVFGNALSERTLQRARFERVYAVVALTPNSALNGLFFQRAREFFGVSQGFIAAAPGSLAIADDLVESDEARVVFDGAHDVERWDVRARHGGIESQEFVFQPRENGEADSPEREETTRGAELFVILAWRRGSTTTPMWRRHSPKTGDVATIAINSSERDEALAELADRGWVLFEPEAEAAVASEATVTGPVQ
jgi:NhaP-type Na+/H+ or K+/H+ antiporter